MRPSDPLAALVAQTAAIVARDAEEPAEMLERAFDTLEGYQDDNSEDDEDDDFAD